MKMEKEVGRKGRKKIGGKEGDNFMFPVTLVPLPPYHPVKNFVRKKPQKKKCWKRGLVRNQVHERLLKPALHPRIWEEQNCGQLRV